MAIGSVKWFHARKRFGFLTVEGIDRDVVVHYSVIQGAGFRLLSEGDRVKVEVGDEGRGPGSCGASTRETSTGSGPARPDRQRACVMPAGGAVYEALSRRHG